MRDWQDLVGKRIRDKDSSAVHLVMKKEWVDQLRTQYMLGIETGILKLPGELGHFTTDSVYPAHLHTALFPTGLGRSQPRILAERIYEPGCQWQLIIKRTGDVTVQKS